MTDFERLEWACEVWNRERHGGRADWTLPDFVRPEFSLATDDQDGQALSIIAIALALDEQARRKLPMSEQAEWAAGVLRERKALAADDWQAEQHHGDWFIASYCQRPMMAMWYAMPLAESLIRREMLGVDRK